MPDDSKITPTDLINKILEPVLAVGVDHIPIKAMNKNIKLPPPIEQIPVLFTFDNEPPSEITCPNCDEPCADERCPNCGAIVWYPGHQISGGSL